jgi:phosphoglycerate dehydrogenase-like enzyme
MRRETTFANTRIVRLNAQKHPITEAEREQYARFGLSPALVEPNTPDEIIACTADAHAVFAVSVTLPAEVITALSRCVVISRMGTGVDKIDVAAATQQGILVTNVPLFCVEEQADHAMALLLALVRKLPQMRRCLEDGAYRHAHDLMRTNQRLSGRTLGLVGFGNSAQAMARRARGFGMRVIATRRNRAAAEVEAAAIGVELTDLETVVAESDYLSLHLPLNTQTYHLFDAALLHKMKPGALLINTSRGALVDEAALVACLRSGHLGGAGLDTFEGIDIFGDVETPPNHPLLQFDNVVLSPHVAAGSVQAMQDVARGAVENVVAVLGGHWPDAINLVNPQVRPRRPLAEFDPHLFAALEQGAELQE